MGGAGDGSGDEGGGLMEGRRTQREEGWNMDEDSADRRGAVRRRGDGEGGRGHELRGCSKLCE